MARIGEKLQKILDVIQEDYSNTTSESRKQLIIQASKEAGIFVNFGINENGAIPLSPLRHYEIQYNIISNADPTIFIEKTHPTWLSLLQIRKQIFELIESIYEIIASKGGGELRYETTDGLIWGPDSEFYNVPRFKVGVDAISLYITPRDTKIKKTFLVRSETIVLVEALSGIPVNHLKRCPECGTYFVQQTLKERKFCSTRCRNRFNMKNKSKK